MTGKTESVEKSAITLEYVTTNHPDIASALRAAGIESVDLSAATEKGKADGLAEGVAEGRKQERERLAGIDAVFAGFEAVQGVGKLMASLKADEAKTPEAAAMALVDLQRNHKGSHLEALRNDAPKGVAASAGGSDNAEGQEDYETLVASAMTEDKNLTKAQAYKKVARENPDAHNKWLAKRNAA